MSTSPKLTNGINKLNQKRQIFNNIKGLNTDSERFREMIDALPMAIYTTDADGRLTHFNKAAVEFSGRIPELGTDHWCVTWKLYHPDGTPMPHNECPMATALKEGRSIEGVEAIAERPDGERLWFAPYPSPLFDKEGEVVGGINMLINITESKKIKTLQQRSEQELSDFFENAPIGLHLLGPDGTILRANKAELEMLGYTREEYVGHNIADFHEDQNVIEEILQKMRAGEVLQEYMARLRCKDGTIRDVVINSNVFQEDGKFIHSRCFTRDVTQQLKIEKEREQLLGEVEREQELLSEVFHKAPSFMCILEGPDHVFKRVNKFYYKLIGNRKVMNKPVRKALPETVTQGFTDLLDRVYQSGKTFRGTEMKINLKRQAGEEAEERVLDFVYQPIQNSKGEVTGIFVQGVDLTERHRTKAELQELNEALEQMNDTLEERVEERTAALLSYQKQLRTLASQLSRAEENERQRLATELHDNLGQILAVSKMKIDILNKQNNSSNEIIELKSLINESIRYTRELMTDLKPPPSLKKEDLSASIHWVAERMKKHNLQVVFSDDKKPRPLTEETRATLRQCIKELLFNTVKHSGTDKAYVDLSLQKNELQIIVEDKGTGFENVDGNPILTENGGFGLFSIRERMEHLGGSLKIESKLGKGTKIILHVPLEIRKNSAVPQQPEASENNEPTSPYLPRNSSKYISVLLADDHDMLRKGLKNLIDGQDDLQVIGEVANGEEAVKVAKYTQPDVVVMDVNMPVMNGIEATRRIVEMFPSVRVIALSLHDSEEVSNNMLDAGAAIYLTKSEAFETLCATIRSEAKLLKKAN